MTPAARFLGDAMNALRTATRERRLKLDAGERFDMETVIGWGVTLDEALTVFSDPPDNADDGIWPRCCGSRATVTSGLMVGAAECETCHARIVDALAPMSSPILERGNAWVSVPGEKLVERMGVRYWLVMHEGDRP